MTSASPPSWPSGPAGAPTRTLARPRICSRAGSLPGRGGRRSRVAESRERTAAEREAARLERERRRQDRAAQPASPASDGDRNGHDAGEEPAWDDSAVRTETRPEHTELDGYDSLAQGAELAEDSDMADDDDDFQDATEEHEVPSGTRRVAHRERLAAGGQRPRRVRRPVRRSRRPVGRSKPVGERSK